MGNLFGNTLISNQITRVISNGDNKLYSSDKYLNYNRKNGNVNLTLPKLTDFINDCNKQGNLISIEMVLSDITDLTTNNYLIISCDSSDNINGTSSFSSNELKGKFKLIATPSGWLLLSSSSSSSSLIPVFFSSGTGNSLPSASGALSDFSTPLYLLLNAGTYIFDTQIHWINGETGTSPACGFGVYYSYADLNPNVDFNTWLGITPINNAIDNYVVSSGKSNTFVDNFNIQSGEVTFTQQSLVKVGFAEPSGNQSYTVGYRSIRAIKTA